MIVRAVISSNSSIKSSRHMELTNIAKYALAVASYMVALPPAFVSLSPAQSVLFLSVSSPLR
jgi:hypothetical protein